MKLVLIAYNQAIDEELMEALTEAGVENYTKWTRVLGKGSTSGPHLATHVWPKANNVLAIAIDQEQLQSLLQQIRHLKDRLGQEGVKAFVLPLEEIT